MSLEIEMSKDGYKILKIEKNNKKIYLGSRYNQKREVEKFIDSIKEITEKDNFIIFGLSFGEHIKELLKLINENGKILIIEFNDELLKYCKNDEEIKKIIDNKRITITSDETEIENFILMNIHETNADMVQNLEYCNYTRIYVDECKGIFKFIRDKLIGIKINRNTYANLGEEFLINIIRNLKYIVNSTTVNKLKNAYDNKPAIIVSAGPSLQNNIDELKGIFNNALILSGGRTLEVLLERKIEPTCLGIVDPGDESYTLVENCIDKVNCSLIFSDQANNKVVSGHKGKKFFYTISNMISEAFDENIVNLSGGGSIAHSLTNLAIHMGCNPIIFIGQDLANTNELNHADFCKSSWEESNVRKDENGTDIYVKDVNGGYVKTSHVLNAFRISLEKIIDRNPQVKFINATEGGAFIKGTDNRKLKDVISELSKDSIQPMAEFFEKNNKTENILRKLEFILTEIDQYINLCRKAQEVLKDYETNYHLKNQHKVDISIKKLNEIDKKIIEKNYKFDFLSLGVLKIIYEVENDKQFTRKISDSKNTVFNKELNRSKVLYIRLKTSFEFCKKEIEEVINKLKGMIDSGD